MIFRKAIKTDAKSIMNIIMQAQEYFKKNNIDQWQNGYLDLKVVNEDIIKENNYILEKDGQIIASVVISCDGERTYNKIYEGNWLSNNKFTVIHRIVVSNRFKGKGLSSILINYAEEISLKKILRV